MGKAKQIELPTKVLREPLRLKKEQFEADGWEITQASSTGQWFAQKEGLRIDGFEKIEQLFPKIEEISAENVQPKQTYDEIPLAQISVSNTTPQKIRRLGFTDENLADITESVRQKGVLEPVLLRRINTGFELAAGERRYLAATRAGLSIIPAIIKVLSDEEVDDIQLHENLHREEPHPLEEAATYAYMEEERGFDLNEIAARAAKTIRYVAGRKELLKLNDQVKDIFRRNELTLSHALEIAKYPGQDQEEILKYAFYNFGHTSQALYPMAKFLEAIGTHYLLLLSKSPFSIKADNLRADGMACSNCPERTGARQLLFEEGVGKNDSCLNRKCYDAKVQKHIQLEREKIVVETKNVPEAKAPVQAKRVPLLSTDYYLSSSEMKKLPEPVIIKHDYEVLKDFSCDKAEFAIFAHGTRNGQKVIVCRKSKGCLVHWRGQTSSIPRDEKPQEVLEAESLDRRNRKEEIIDVNVGEIVRRKVLAEAAKKFDAENTIFNHPDKADDFLYQLINTLWKFQCHFSTDNRDIIIKALGLKKIGKSYTDEEPCQNLTPVEVSRLFWLILHAPLAKLYENGDWRSQDKVKQIAEDFGVDYQMIDAVERLKYAQDKHEKHTKEYHDYLVKLENGDRKAKIPRVYSPDYKPKEGK